MPNNTRGTETDAVYRYCLCNFCGQRFQLPRAGIPGGALAAANRLTGMTNRHEAKCPRNPEVELAKIEAVIRVLREGPHSPSSRLAALEARRDELLKGGSRDR